LGATLLVSLLTSWLGGDEHGWCLVLGWANGDMAGLPCPGVEQGQVAAWGREEQRGVWAAREHSHINLETEPIGCGSALFWPV